MQDQTAVPGASLLDVARKLYNERGKLLSLRDIAERMEVSHEWVRRFVKGDIPNPGVLNVERFIATIKELTR